MFTGIIDHCGEIQSIKTGGDSATVCIGSQFDDLQLGESIAVDGACVTVVKIEKNTFTCELSPETLQLTIARQYIPGASVNLERALRLRDRLGGHFVAGHVDQTLVIADIQTQGEFTTVNFSGVPTAERNYLTAKSSIAINGVSLTINAVRHDSFSVMLIPHTLQCTNLKYLQRGEKVNVEFDLIAKTIARQVQIYLLQENDAHEFISIH